MSMVKELLNEIAMREDKQPEIILSPSEFEQIVSHINYLESKVGVQNEYSRVD